MATDDSNNDSANNERKGYRAPQLLRFGALQQVTHGSRGGNADGSKKAGTEGKVQKQKKQKK